ncbi:class F sortase [Amycolatopsis palatopharyngis]|uniref:class F sortase n=1 Tax=Amycolatopsis palatopharyngis TaxID=187982 RepID=UPI001FE55570|nr:class F sortase [Amycolatopsis palatopharyngis]
MTNSTAPVRRRWQLVAAACAAVVVLVSVLVTVLLTGQSEPATTAGPAATTSVATSTTEQTAIGATAGGDSGELPRARPATMEIPAIGVSTGAIIDLGLEPDGALEVPGDAVTAGWFTESPTPGELGPSIIAGHVDYRKVPGVFFRLHELPVGEKVVVHREDGTTVEFTVDRVERYPKAEFPTEEVYGNTDAPELRLITCGGVFDSSSGEYADNVVAYATMTGSSQG